MFPELPRDFMQLNTSEAINLAQKLRREGQEVSAKDELDYRYSLKQMPYLNKKFMVTNRFTEHNLLNILQPLAGGGIAKLAGVDQAQHQKRSSTHKACLI